MMERIDRYKAERHQYQILKHGLVLLMTKEVKLKITENGYTPISVAATYIWKVIEYGYKSSGIIDNFEKEFVLKTCDFKSLIFSESGKQIVDIIF